MEISEVKFGKIASQKPIKLESVRKILEATKIIWQQPSTIYKTAQGHYVPEDYANYLDYFDLYGFIGPVGRALDIKNTMIWQNGFTTQSESEADKQKADEFMQLIDADVLLSDLSLTTLICGNAYTWINREPKLELRTLDPLSISCDIDEKTGLASQWYQSRGVGVTELPIKIDDLLHLRFRKIRNNVYGQGNLKRVLAVGKSMLYMKQKVPEIVRKRSDHPLHIKIGDSDHRVPDEVFNKLVTSMKQRGAGEDFFEDGWVTIDEVYKSLSEGRMAGIVELIKMFERDMISGLGVPEEALGYGQSTTQATAEYQKEQLNQEIVSYQRTIKRFIEQKIFPLGEISPEVRIQFNPLTPEDMLKASQRYQGEVKTGIIGPAFARKKLGYPEEEAGQGAMPQTGGPGFA